MLGHKSAMGLAICFKREADNCAARGLRDFRKFGTRKNCTPEMTFFRLAKSMGKTKTS